MIIFNSIYEKGFQAGVNAQMLADKEAQNHRLEDMLRRGKKIGYDEGFVEGYTKGHERGYDDGYFDCKAKNGIIELNDENAVCGEWVAHSDNEVQKFCSICGNEAPITDVLEDGTVFYELTEFCPSCGAKMDIKSLDDDFEAVEDDIAEAFGGVE